MDEAVRFYTLSSSGEGFYKEKGSKFLSFAYPVRSEGDIKGRLEELRKQYYDARHHCYAFQLGLDQPIIRANDDGEPNHSAGDPILGQIKSFGLTNVLVVVVRYFGGTKLGVGGLINAYRIAAQEALEGIEQMEIVPAETFVIQYTYEQTPAIERLLKQFELFDVERSFEANCTVKAGVRPEKKAELIALATDLQLNVVWE
jgi:uncharacterized YigZ family protein